MEHIVQFAIGIDDDGIRQRVKEAAYDDVVKQLMQEAKKEMHLDGRYYQRETWRGGGIVEDALHKYFDENKDLIIELAANKLADSYKRTKVFKETMTKKMEECE